MKFRGEKEVESRKWERFDWGFRIADYRLRAEKGVFVIDKGFAIKNLCQFKRSDPAFFRTFFEA